MKKNEILDWKSIQDLPQPLTAPNEIFEVWTLVGVTIFLAPCPGYGLYIGQLPGQTPTALLQVNKNGETTEFPGAKNFINYITLEYKKAYSDDPSEVGPWRDGYILWSKGLNKGKGPSSGCPACNAIKKHSKDKEWIEFFLSLLITNHSTTCPYSLYQKMI
ncbi:hypothetical protein [Butyricimonas sp.]|uniref:hypothetical protein n=1 Tax=Butyricimonas sp. TaxID=1969738 RepID=UPI0025C2AB96|nr:hypothetical protein [Butyricimonas sp.]